MDDEIDIQDLDAYEIRELLLDQGSEVDEEQAAALTRISHHPASARPPDLS